VSQHIRRWRWQVPLAALVVVLAYQALRRLWFMPVPALDFVLETVFYGLTSPALIWFALGWVEIKVAQNEAAEAGLVQAHAELTHLTRRVAFLLNVNQRLSEVTDEESLAALALQLPGEAVPSIVGCALVRFDEHHQPMPVEYRGVLDETTLAEWHRHLSSHSVKLQCAVCQPRTARPGQLCAVYDYLPFPGADRIICLPLERNGKQFAILGLFIAAGQDLTGPERDLLEALTAEIALALENTRLHTHELVTLYDINEALHQRLDFDGLMTRILTRTMEASHADAGLLLLKEPDGTLTPAAASGEWRGAGPLPFVEALAMGALNEGSGDPVIANLQTPHPSITSVLCAPMLSDTGPLGVIVLGSHRREAFLRQQMRLVAAIAGQAALLAENARLYARLEHQAILAERGRLAREMHDGLAQTLGYLKMRSGQIARWLEAGQTEQATGALHELAQTANDAYLDLRAALDGLRLPLVPHPGESFTAQLQRLARTFESQSSLTVAVTIEAEPALPVPAQAHLLRIAQESLTNIRKHARARHARLTFTTADHHLRLVIADDGQGFDPRADPRAAHYGLLLMRERADLLGAEFSVTSQPGAGTQICVELADGRFA
jgi:two-component system nitrate/nitrite sensor histidine kinase NarX